MKSIEVRKKEAALENYLTVDWDSCDDYLTEREIVSIVDNFLFGDQLRLSPTIVKCYERRSPNGKHIILDFHGLPKLKKKVAGHSWKQYLRKLLNDDRVRLQLDIARGQRGFELFNYDAGVLFDEKTNRLGYVAKPSSWKLLFERTFN